MLLQFKFRNHRSFREESTLSFVSTSRGDAPLHRFSSPHAKHGVLPVLGLWGGNASGKSNAVDALKYFHDAVERSHRKWGATDPAPWFPWHEARGGADPASEYALDLELEGTRYAYSFTVGAAGFLSEALWRWKGSRSSLLFSREGPGEGTWKFGPSFGGRREHIRGLTRSNSLFLSAGAQENHLELLAVYRAIVNGIRFERAIALSGFPVFTPDHPIVQPTFRERVASIVLRADLGIEALEVVPHEERPWPPAAKELFRDEALQKLTEAQPRDMKRVRLRHHGGWTPEPEEESRGTSVLLQRLGDVLQALDDGTALVIDELDTSLHPDLCAELIGLFTMPSTNPRGAQLLFTSHQRELLPLLRTDEIILVDKGRDGASTLVPASDFKGVRNGAEVGRLHRAGRVGGVPVLGDLRATVAGGSR